MHCGQSGPLKAVHPSPQVATTSLQALEVLVWPNNTSPFSRKDPQKSPPSFRIAAKDLEDPALQCRKLVVKVEQASLQVEHVKTKSRRGTRVILRFCFMLEKGHLLVCARKWRNLPIFQEPLFNSFIDGHIYKVD